MVSFGLCVGAFLAGFVVRSMLWGWTPAEISEEWLEHYEANFRVRHG